MGFPWWKNRHEHWRRKKRDHVFTPWLDPGICHGFYITPAVFNANTSVLRPLFDSSGRRGCFCLILPPASGGVCDGRSPYIPEAFHGPPRWLSAAPARIPGHRKKSTPSTIQRQRVRGFFHGSNIRSESGKKLERCQAKNRVQVCKKVSKLYVGACGRRIDGRHRESCSTASVDTVELIDQN